MNFLLLLYCRDIARILEAHGTIDKNVVMFELKQCSFYGLDYWLCDIRAYIIRPWKYMRAHMSKYRIFKYLCAREYM